MLKQGPRSLLFEIYGGQPHTSARKSPALHPWTKRLADGYFSPMKQLAYRASQVTDNSSNHHGHTFGNCAIGGILDDQI